MDLLIIEQGDGGELIFDGNDIATDNGFYTSIYLSLFSGNCFAKIFDEDVSTNSDFINALFQTITQDMLRNVESMAKKSLKWLIEDGVASSLEVKAISPEYRRIDIMIKIIEPNNKESIYSILWDCERSNVARFINLSNGYYETNIIDHIVNTTFDDGSNIEFNNGDFVEFN